jgi:hypothetical protein
MPSPIRLSFAELIFAGLIATAALGGQAPQASARPAIAIPGMASSPAPATSNQPCEQADSGTTLGDATTSLAQLGSSAPWAQASVLIVGLGCLAGSGVWFKHQVHRSNFGDRARPEAETKA